ncbi:MAG: DNA polymerase Y family protein [Akkermansiaceae bacterium]
MNFPLTALFVDFDAYFASAEQHLQPYLRGKPVGVAPVMAESTSCIAASYEAKAFGIKTGTRVSDARKMCPGIHIITARPPLYVDLHHRLVAAVESCLHVEAVLSIDEMWCWLPYNLREPEMTLKIAERIRAAIKDQVSPWIHASIGISSNKWLAKMASKMRKPNGLLMIEKHQLPDILYELELRDIHGVGRAMAQRLHTYGIHDVRSLCLATREQLHVAWGGIEGDRLWLQLRGQEVPRQETSRQSIGHSHVLSPEKRPASEASAVLHKLTQKAATRLRKHGLLAASYQLSIRYLQGERWEGELLLEPTDDSLVFARTAGLLWKQRPLQSEPLLKISITFSKITSSGNYTPSLFLAAGKKLSKTVALNQSMDLLVKKFGQKSLYLGGAHNAIESAPARIAFGHIPEFDSDS